MRKKKSKEVELEDWERLAIPDQKNTPYIPALKLLDPENDLIGGIDPGKTGGFVTLNLDGTICKVMHVPRLPPVKKHSAKREIDYPKMRDEWGPQMRRCRHVFVERVWGAAVEGRQQGGAGMFNFGYSAGVPRGLLLACGVTHDLILPQKWKQMLALINTDKASSLDLARKLFPDSVAEFKRKTVDEGVAESALIAYAGRLILSGETFGDHS